MEVYNYAVLYDPDGNIVGKVKKFHLTPPEISTLHLTPGFFVDVAVRDKV